MECVKIERVMSGWQEFTGLNRGYVLELYEKYRQDPSSVDPETRALFERWTPPTEDAPARSRPGVPLEKIVGAVNLAQSIRRYGHLAAQLDPLGSRRRSAIPSLLAATHGVTEEDLRACRPPSSPARSTASSTALDAIEALRRIYCSTTGYDFAHVFVPEERDWLRQAVERGPLPRAGRSDRSGRAARSADRRSRRSSGSCTARSPARRASRSRGSTCSCRSSTR